jgi:hypothetical protein
VKLKGGEWNCGIFKAELAARRIAVDATGKNAAVAAAGVIWKCSPPLI